MKKSNTETLTKFAWLPTIVFTKKTGWIDRGLGMKLLWFKKYEETTVTGQLSGRRFVVSREEIKNDVPRSNFNTTDDRSIGSNSINRLGVR